jgi:hypothetical protein
MTTPEPAVTSRSQQIASPDPDGGGGSGRVRPTGSARPTLAERVPWRSVGTGVVSLGAPTGIAALHPLLGGVIASVELVVILTIIGTALFGSQVLSDRAFRLLRWIGNRPEPPGPSDSVVGS